MKRILVLAALIATIGVVPSHAAELEENAETTFEPARPRIELPARFTVPFALPTAPQGQTPRPPDKSATAAVLLSILIPGGGQFYNGDHGKGAAMLGAGMGGLALFVYGVTSTKFDCDNYCYETNDFGLIYAGLGLMAGMTVYSAIDAGVRAGEINQQNRAANQVTTHLNRLRLALPKGDGVRVAYRIDF